MKLRLWNAGSGEEKREMHRWDVGKCPISINEMDDEEVGAGI